MDLRSLILVFLLVCPVSASYIQLTSKVTPPGLVSSGVGNLTVSFTNSGDETAYGLWVELISSAVADKIKVEIGDLGPGESVDKLVEFILPDDLVGRYPLIVMTHYADGNQYPFSQISFTYLQAGSITPITVTLSSEKLTLYGDGRGIFRFEVSNRDDVEHNMIARIYLPDELACDETVKDFSVDGKNKAFVEFDVRNFGAVPPATYTGVVEVGYDYGGVHYSALKSEVIEVQPHDKTLVYGAAAAIFVLAAFILKRQFFTRR